MSTESPRKSHPTPGEYQTKMSTRQRILTSKLFQVGPNGETLDNPWVQNATIVVLKSNGRILDVRPTNDEDLAAIARSDQSVGGDESKAEVLDLRGLTILPGFIDTHVHCKDNGPFTSRLATCDLPHR
jgi:imidazolonepropionase-like amidohydrolase